MKIIINEKCPKLSASWSRIEGEGSHFCCVVQQDRRYDWYTEILSRAIDHVTFYVARFDEGDDPSWDRTIELVAENDADKRLISGLHWHMKEKEAHHFLFFNPQFVEGSFIKGVK